LADEFGGSPTSKPGRIDHARGSREGRYRFGGGKKNEKETLGTIPGRGKGGWAEPERRYGRDTKFLFEGHIKSMTTGGEEKKKKNNIRRSSPGRRQKEETEPDEGEGMFHIPKCSEDLRLGER